jgi:hypothetical protein
MRLTDEQLGQFDRDGTCFFPVSSRPGKYAP